MVKHYVLITCFLFSYISIVNAQTPLPYFTGFDNASEQSGWTEYDLGVTSTYPWEFYAFNFYSSPNCLRRDYPVGGSQVTDGWMVSPAFDFTNGGNIDSLRYAFAGFGTPATGDTIALYMINGSQDPSVGSWTLLELFSDASYSNDGVYRLLSNVAIPATSGSSYIAFRYRTINNWLEPRFDNLAISGSGAASVNEVASNNVSVWPNPTSDLLQIQLPEQSGVYQVTVTDLSGKRLISERTGDNTISVESLNNGIYLMQVEINDHIYTTRFVKH